jgi:ribonuclease PH
MRTTRANDELREIKIERGYSRHGASVIIHIGHTIVNCSASISNYTPNFVPPNSGWITAEYSMLPSATKPRSNRDRQQSPNGRNIEIQRLIGRALRGIADLETLDGYTIQIDCDVLNADGGTRCAAITGAYIVLAQTIATLQHHNIISSTKVLRSLLGAVSVGIVNGELFLDLEYSEDSIAEVDLNLIMTADQQIIEIQGTAEKAAFSHTQLNQMIELASTGIQQIIAQSQSFISAYPIVQEITI